MSFGLALEQMALVFTLVSGMKFSVAMITSIDVTVQISVT